MPSALSSPPPPAAAGGDVVVGEPYASLEAVRKELYSAFRGGGSRRGWWAGNAFGSSSA